jgi:hypothetical protein
MTNIPYSFTTIEKYEQEALDLWMAHFHECAESLGIDVDYHEEEYAREAWHECKEVKFIEYDSVLKIKWEHRCWWGDCPSPRLFHGSYSCILMNIPVDRWEEPFARAKRLEE